MNRDEVDALVKGAITRVIDAERELFERNVAERALAHHLARFIRDGIPPPYVVDLEYNRHKDDPKRLRLPSADHEADVLKETLVSPDIIVHVRGTDDHNLLVLEVKKLGGDIGYDERKLRAFREQLRYRHAAHIILGRGPDDEIIHRVIWLD